MKEEEEEEDMSKCVAELVSISHLWYELPIIFDLCVLVGKGERSIIRKRRYHDPGEGRTITTKPDRRDYKELSYLLVEKGGINGKFY